MPRYTILKGSLGHEKEYVERGNEGSGWLRVSMLPDDIDKPGTRRPDGHFWLPPFYVPIESVVANQRETSSVAFRARRGEQAVGFVALAPAAAVDTIREADDVIVDYTHFTGVTGVFYESGRRHGLLVANEVLCEYTLAEAKAGWSGDIDVWHV